MLENQVARGDRSGKVRRSADGAIGQDTHQSAFETAREASGIHQLEIFSVLLCRHVGLHQRQHHRQLQLPHLQPQSLGKGKHRKIHK